MTVEAPPRGPGQDELDALIEEARRRARRRRLGYAAFVIALLGAAGGIYFAFGGGGGGAAKSDEHGSPSGGAAPPSARSDPRSRPTYGDRNCTRAGEITGEALFVCYQPNQGDHGTFILGSPDSNGALPVGLPPLPGRDVVGHWSWAAVAPSEDKLLLQWSGECEAPMTFVVGADGGLPRAIADLSPATESIALGWTPSNRALVVALSGGCPGSSPRLLEVSKTGTILKRWSLTEHEAKSLESSIAPRTVGNVVH